ncbi:hypothetical protein Zmor_017214 [Zophobas morio]|uniref:Uncharacterized protein n=1 Tax=Zophobas morio TaxID=2755281 RepID=A0AA38MCA0_9CUCU|nr:hypothetical protein Zmor_017214 [Zophobas morio]
MILYKSQESRPPNTRNTSKRIRSSRPEHAAITNHEISQFIKLQTSKNTKRALKGFPPTRPSTPTTLFKLNRHASSRFHRTNSRRGRRRRGLKDGEKRGL